LGFSGFSHGITMHYNARHHFLYDNIFVF